MAEFSVTCRACGQEFGEAGSHSAADCISRLRDEVERLTKDCATLHESNLKQTRSLELQIRAKDEMVRKLCEALAIRRAMEPKHSDMEHTCPECEFVAEIIHSGRSEKPKCGLSKPLGGGETCVLDSGHRGPCDHAEKRKCLHGVEVGDGPCGLCG